MGNENKDVNTALLTELTQKEDKIITMEKNNRNIIVAFIVVIGIIFLFLSGIILYQRLSFNHDLAKQIMTLTRIRNRQAYNKLSYDEQYSRYSKFMMNVFTVYSKTYRKRYIVALSPEQKADYIDLTFKLATELDIPLFWVPVIHLLESRFNPNAWNKTSGLNERGLNQMTWDTALGTEKYIDNMNYTYRKLLSVDLKKPEDLFDWRTSTKLTFGLLLHLREMYHNRVIWMISIYHWGGFLSRSWDGGKGKVPATFKINNIKYYVYKYYYAWQSLVTAFENYDLEPGKDTVELWKRYQKQMIKEEIELRRGRNTIRKLKRKVDEHIKLKKDLEEETITLQKEINKTLAQLDKQYNLAGKQKDIGKMRKIMNKHKKIIKQFLRKTRTDKKK